MRTKTFVVWLFLALWLVPIGTLSAAEVTWTRLEGFGNVGIQNNSGGGKSYAGGVRYAPAITLAPAFAAKPFVGVQMLKGTDKEIYPILDYGAMGQLLHFDPVIVDVGLGLGTSFRKNIPTRFMMALGGEYKLPTPILGLIDRVVADARYYFESSDLFIINYGVSMSF